MLRCILDDLIVGVFHASVNKCRLDLEKYFQCEVIVMPRAKLRSYLQAVVEKLEENVSIVYK